jgi:hypothetical protein
VAAKKQVGPSPSSRKRARRARVKGAGKNKKLMVQRLKNVSGHVSFGKKAATQVAPQWEGCMLHFTVLRKIVAMAVMLVFLSVIGVSAYPLHAAGPDGAQDKPGAIEKASESGKSATKSSILPIVLIVVGVGALAAVLFLVVLKTSYDITGNWTWTYSYSGGSFTYPVVFTGTKESGTMVMNGSVNGTYTVSAENVTCSVSNTHQKWEFIGKFNSKTNITGEFRYYWDNVLHPEWGGTFLADKH